MVSVTHKHKATAEEAASPEVEIDYPEWNDEHDPGNCADVLTDHDKTLHDSLGINAATLEGSTKAQVQDHTPQTHKNSHKSGGSDAFASTDVLESVGKRLQESSGPTNLLMGNIADGQYLKRSGTGIIGDTPAGGGYQPQSVNQSATVAPTSATWTDVPGLTLTLAPGTYIFAVNILYVKSGAGFGICDRRIRVVDASHTLIMSQVPYFSFSTGILTNWCQEITLIRSFQVSAETTFHVECYAVVEIMHSHNFQNGNFSVFPL